MWWMPWPNKKCALVSFGVGICSALIVALFWYMWSLYAPVPEVAFLPSSISRWTDIIALPLIVMFFVVIQGKSLGIPSENTILFCSIASAISCGMFVIGMIFGFVDGIIVGIILGLVYAIAFGIFFGIAEAIPRLAPFFRWIIRSDSGTE